MNEEKVEPKSVDFQRETANAPESGWLFAWAKSATLYVGIITAYLGGLGAFMVAWKKFVATEGGRVGFTTWLLAGIFALPFLFALFFNLLPTIRRSRERNMRPTGIGKRGYFTTSPREEDTFGFFSKDYEAFLNWARKPKAPMLHLTGLSGSGKSSLLYAYLRPRLAEEIFGSKTELIVVRSYRNPLQVLKSELLALWKQKPDDYDNISPFEAVRRATRQLGAKCRLLIAFDQFEEYFLLHALFLEEGNKPGKKPASGESNTAEELEELKDFLHNFIKNPPERACVLLSYREDHRRLLQPLDLTPRQEGENWMTVEPLDFATATKFLRSCPGLNIPSERLNCVLREAARQEGGRVIMRPIVANILGLILQKMSSHPTLWRQSDDLLRGYVSGCLGVELKDERVRILRLLLSDFHTARPRPMADISRETGLGAADLEVHLDHFGRAGLLRCLNPKEITPQKRIWQIAHDFLATLIERSLDGAKRTIWRTLRPWLTPASISLAIIICLVGPYFQRLMAINHLANEGFTWNEDNRVISVSKNGRSKTDIATLANTLHRLAPVQIDLSGCDKLQNVDCFKGLTELQALDLSGCEQLKNVDGLKELTKLRTLNLSGCGKLQNVDGLKGLIKLQTLDLSKCDKLQNVDGLKGLIALQTLDLRLCEQLENVNGLDGLIALQTLDLNSCIQLQSIDGLRSLISLRMLFLTGCKHLQNINGLDGLIALQTLYLNGCDQLQNIDPLKGLTTLQSLDLRHCTALQNFEGLKGLTGLQTLDLSGGEYIPNIVTLKGLIALQELYLSECKSLQEVDSLRVLTKLRTLDLRWCRKLRNVDGIKGLPSLRRLYLTGCVNLQNVDCLKGVTALRILDFRLCTQLQTDYLTQVCAAIPNCKIVEN